jgi:glycosyltransferase involved in cell wall biosynthesis
VAQAERLPTGVPAVVVGDAVGAHAIRHRLRGLEAARLGFRWLGHMSDQELLAQLWLNCAVYVHGHSVGGTNPALLQALGCGSPTLAVDTPFNREVLDGGGQDDQLVPAEADVLSERLLAILADGNRRQRLSSRGRAIVAERYRWEDVCAAYRALLAGLAERSRTVTPVGRA